MRVNNPGRYSKAASRLIGAFHLGAIVDETRSAPELIESNNRITGAPITFGE